MILSADKYYFLVCLDFFSRHIVYVNTTAVVTPAKSIQTSLTWPLRPGIKSWIVSSPIAHSKPRNNGCINFVGMDCESNKPSKANSIKCASFRIICIVINGNHCNNILRNPALSASLCVAGIHDCEKITASHRIDSIHQMNFFPFTFTKPSLPSVRAVFYIIMHGQNYPPLLQKSPDFFVQFPNVYPYLSSVNVRSVLQKDQNPNKYFLPVV